MRYFKDLSNNVSGYEPGVDGQEVMIAEAIANGHTEITGNWPPPPPIEELRQIAISNINVLANMAVSAISSAYPQFEIDTFASQEKEAREWLADNSVLTPTLTPIALARGIAMEDLATRVIYKADLFRPFTADIIGRRQAFEDRIDAAEDAAGVAAVMEEAQLSSSWQG